MGGPPAPQAALLGTLPRIASRTRDGHRLRHIRGDRYLKQRWTDEELVKRWTLFPDELALLSNKSGATRLGFAVILRFFAVEGRFLREKAETPEEAVRYVAEQARVRAEEWPRYAPTGRAARYHRAEIREFFGFRECTAVRRRRPVPPRAQRLQAARRRRRERPQAGGDGPLLGAHPRGGVDPLPRNPRRPRGAALRAGRLRNGTIARVPQALETAETPPNSAKNGATRGCSRAWQKRR